MTDTIGATPGRAEPREGERGFTLIETLIALVVATISIIGVLVSLGNGVQLQQQTGGYEAANRAIAEIHATLRSGDLDARVADFQSTPTQTIGGVDVRVSFPEQLLVDVLGTAVPVGWRYRDLTADGEVDLDPAATATVSLVPVSVTAVWAKGSMRTSFFLTER